MSLSKFLSNFQFVLSWDLFIILAFIVIIFFYGLSVGRNRLVAVLLSIYFSFIITQSIPWAGWPFLQLKNNALPTYEIFTFLVIILALLFLLPQSGFGSALRLHRRGKAPWSEILILSILQIGLLIYLIISFLPNKFIADLNPLLEKVFTGETMKFVWFSLPIIALVFLGRKSKDE